MLKNKYGQEIRPGDFVIAAHQKGSSNFYIVRAIGEKKTRVMLRSFYLSTYILDETTGRYERVPIEQAEIGEEDTFVNFPEDVFRVSIEEYISIHPLIREAYLNAHREIIATAT